MRQTAWARTAIEDLLQDVRSSVRLLRRAPGFAALSLTCVALGVGVATTMFSAVSGLLLRPLPYPDDDRLAIIHTRDVTRARDTGAVSWADFVVWRADATSFETTGTWASRPADVIVPGAEPAPVVVGQISAGLLPALGQPPILGRDFEDRDQAFGKHFVAILSHGYWQRRFGGRAEVLGETVTIEQRPVPPKPYTIVGVLPPGLTFPPDVDLFVPFQVDADEYDRHGATQVRGAVARLRRNVSLAQARTEVVAISKRLQDAFPRDNANREAQVTTLRDELVGDRRTPILLLQCAAGFVLLIACANLANLSLARAGVRQRELAVRAAIGASRGRIARLLLTESLVVALAGGALGASVALLGSRLLVLIIPGGIPEYADLAIDGPALAFALVLSTLAGVFVGLGPAWQGAAADQTALREHRQGGGGGGRLRVLRAALIAAEVAVSFVLVAGAALVWRSMQGVISELRYDRQVLWISVPTPPERYEGLPRETFFRDLVDRLRALPGVDSVGRAAVGVPLEQGSRQRVPVQVDGGAPAGATAEAVVAEVDPGYLSTIGVPIVSGRGFTDEDRPASAAVRSFAAIVNETFARSVLGPNALGRQVKATLPGASSLGTLTFTVVGVSRDYRQERPPARIAPVMHVYVPFGSSNTPLVVRASAGAALVGPQVRAIVRQMDPALRVAVVQSFEDGISRGLAQERLYLRVLGLFALLALALAAVGVFCVCSYLVGQRMQEFGIRLALGATPVQLFRLVVGQGLGPMTAGLALGGLVAMLTTRFLSGVIHGIGPTDPLTFVAAAVVLAAIAVSASLLPAARAAGADPTSALRD